VNLARTYAFIEVRGITPEIFLKTQLCNLMTSGHHQKWMEIDAFSSHFLCCTGSAAGGGKTANGEYVLVTVEHNTALIRWASISLQPTEPVPQSGPSLPISFLFPSVPSLSLSLPLTRSFSRALCPNRGRGEGNARTQLLQGCATPSQPTAVDSETSWA